jgi:hypothetical protein
MLPWAVIQFFLSFFLSIFLSTFLSLCYNAHSNYPKSGMTFDETSNALKHKFHVQVFKSLLCTFSRHL